MRSARDRCAAASASPKRSANRASSRSCSTRYAPRSGAVVGSGPSKIGLSSSPEEYGCPYSGMPSPSRSDAANHQSCERRIVASCSRAHSSARLDLEHLRECPGRERRLGERHGRRRVGDRRAGAAQVLAVARRQVVARREHAVLVHDVGQLPVGAREPEGELELLPRELGVAVAQPDRDEVGVPLPEADVADLRWHHGAGVAERRQLDDVGAEHPPAERGHRLQVARARAGSARTSRARSTRWPRDRRDGRRMPRAGRCGRRRRRSAPPRGASRRARPRRCRAVGRPSTRPRAARPVTADRRESARGPAKPSVAAPPPNSITCGSTRVIGSAAPVASRTTSVSSTRHSSSDRSYSEVCTRTPSPSRNTSRRERGRVNGRLHQVEVLARERGERSGIRGLDTGCAPPRPAAVRTRDAHRPPRPDAAMLFRIRRWPITKAMSIGIVASADAAITSP